MFRRATRRSIFWIVVVCYIVTAIFLIGFTSGYRIKLFPFTVARTGNIHVSFEPRDAEIQLDAARITNRSPAVVRSVFPGMHTIRISRDGFLPFQKSIRVQPLITTFVEHISLVRNAPVITYEGVISPLHEDLLTIDKDGIVAQRSILTRQVDFFTNEKKMFSLPGTRMLAHEFSDVAVILVYSPFELWSVNIKTKTPTLMARLSAPIRATVPVPESGLLLVVQQTQIIALQLTDPTADPLLILSGTDIRSAIVTEDGVLVFTDVVNGVRQSFARAL